MARDLLTTDLLDAFDVVLAVDRDGRIVSVLRATTGLAASFARVSDFILVEGPILPLRDHELPAGAAFRNGPVLVCGRLLLERDRLLFVGRDASRELELQERYEALEERHRQLVDRSPIALITQIGDRVAQANPAACSLLGATRSADVLGRNVAELFGTDKLDSFLETSREHSMRTLDGREIIVAAVANSIVHEGRPGRKWLLRDLTMQKAMATALRDEQHQFEAVMSTVVTAITLVDRRGTIVYANEMARVILGLESTDVVTRRYDDPVWRMQAVDGGPWSDEDQPFNRVMTTGRPVLDVRHAIIWPDGQRKVLSINGAPITDDSGQISSAVFSIEDITDRLEKERELEESRETLSLCIDGSGIGTWDWNVKTGDVDFNDHWAHMLGFELDEIAPDVSSWERLVHPDDLPKAMAALEDHFQGKTSLYRLEHRLLTKSGEWKWILDSGRVFSRDAHGKPLRMLGTHLDIDAIKRAEEERLQLELRVQKAARYECMSVLASGVAHDFNNLLVGIIGAAGVAQLDLDAGSPVLPTIKLIESAGRRAAELTEQMLAFAGKGRYLVEALDLNDLIREMSELLGAAANRRLRIGYSFTAIPPIEADATQIRHVVMNLVMNAIEACDRLRELPDHPVLVRTRLIELGPEDVAAMSATFDLQPGKYVVLEVDDCGAGMDAAVLERVFDPFFSTKGAGHGFGLAAVMGIVKGHRGFIRASSRKGEGAEFQVGFPLLQDIDGKEREMDKAPRVEARHVVLVIDDEELVATVIRVALQRQGYEVIVTSNGQDGIARFSAEHARLAVVYLDMSMPGMGGGEALDRMKAIAPDVPIVVMSGFSAEEAGIESVADRMAAFVKKPFRPDDLVMALELALKRR